MTRNHTDWDMRKKPRLGWRIMRIIGMVIGGVLLAALLAFVLGFVVQWLWNWLMPGIFGLKQISYWQAFGLLFLAKLLFGGLGHHGSPHPGKSFHRHHDRRKDYERIWREKGDAAADDLISRAERERSGERETEGDRQ